MNNKSLYKKIEKLRKNINIIKYKELKEKNKGDLIYGWAFDDEMVLNETLKELKEMYQDYYINDVLNVYLEILLNCQVIDKLDYKKSYNENKSILEEQAINYSNNMNLFDDISYYELAIIQNYFLKNGKKFGLLNEFKENGRC